VLRISTTDDTNIEAVVSTSKGASNLLWPFKLSSSTGDFRTRKAQRFIDGGDLGNWEEHLYAVIEQMDQVFLNSELIVIATVARFALLPGLRLQA
jgi:hypothetical protein